MRTHSGSLRIMKHWGNLAVLICVLQVVYRAMGADTTKPTVAISQPANGASLSGSFNVSVTASDSGGIASVSLKVDGATVATSQTGSPYNFSVAGDQLFSGTHTLLAVATDNSGNATRSSVVTVTVTEPQLYSLGTGPFVAENLGTVISANTQEKQIMFRLPSNNELHLLMYYDVDDIANNPLQILDANLTRGTARLTDAVPGRPGPVGSVLHSNGKIYLGSANPGYLFEYDPNTGATNLVAQLHPAQRRDTQMMEVSDNGWVCIGEFNPFGGGSVERYNPSTKAFEDLGVMDAAFVGSQFSYSLGGDSRYVFVGLGQVPWYLAVYDTQTKAKTLYWKSENDTYGEVMHANAGGWYYRRATTSGDRWYQFVNGAPVEISASAVPAHHVLWSDTGNVVMDNSLFPSSFNIEVNLDKTYPDNSGNFAVISWRTVGASTWQSLQVNGFRLQPINTKRLYAWDSSHLFGFADFYGPVFTYDTVGRSALSLGRPQYSLYDGLLEQGNVYLSGYSSATLVYNPAKSWSLTSSTTNQLSASINPRKFSADFGKYHYYSTFGCDGLVYIGGFHIRDSDGGELGWIDPLTGG